MFLISFYQLSHKVLNIFLVANKTDDDYEFEPFAWVAPYIANRTVSPLRGFIRATKIDPCVRLTAFHSFSYTP